MNPFDSASPFDARYYFADAGFYDRLHPYVSEKSQVRYLARVEAALAETLCEYGVCPASAAKEIAGAVDQVTPEEVYEEERRIQHNIRALVNSIRNRISPEARPYVHLFATSADIMDTARALCLKEATGNVVTPMLADVTRPLIGLARAHANTPKMARTHGP